LVFRGDKHNRIPGNEENMNIKRNLRNFWNNKNGQMGMIGAAV
jgi:hypothetical protein